MTENLLKKKKKGFTLIELIVVIAIIAIISLIAIPKVMGYQDDAKKKADIANAKTIANVAATEITNGHIAPPDGGLNIEIKSGYTRPANDAVASTDVTAGGYITSSLQSIPTMQFSTNAKKDFWISITKDGTVTVYDSSAHTNELFPAPNGIYN
ncbi:prepilin-type N-terminal cleavage/methylation domain-containing protein [Clostridium aciditolerans]|uniref:Prepilin-type N-terminal cleavage/methylation domain-containing protein n=1 Tax=Clostridium aciditolerans TaxID=339861 RepID=A0A934I0N8_9CLOT|nr:prepilin-type N-terminal cleavage/methylation domain-containing protein [Clostridium aciditolerans]